MTQDTKENSMPHVDEGTLHAYLDGELPSAERKTLETHLAECASCRTQLAEERALLERASALLGATRPVERPVPPFEQLRPTPRALKRSVWRVRTPVAWAASIALALGLGYYLHEPGAQPAGSMLEQQNITLYRQEDERRRIEPQAAENKPAPATTTPRPSRKLAAAPAPTVATIPPGRRDSATAAAAGARADSGVALNREADKSAAGVVAILPQAATPQLRNAAPPTVALASKANDSTQLQEALIIVDGVQASMVAASRGPTTTTWPIISRGTARTLLGTDPVGLPGLARQIRRSPANDGTVVVEQKIDSATTIQIFQQQNATAAFYRIDTSVRADKAAVVPADRLARYVGRLRVEIAGPLSSDSLNKLLDQVQPLP
jgi:putative zinc finger protein